MKLRYLLLGLFFLTVCVSKSISQNDLLSNERYITSEDGIIRMYVNVIGHVKNPGTYFVYDGIDLLSAISLAGGFKEGSDLKNIIIYNSDTNNEYSFSFSDLIDGDESIVLQPHDTILIEQTSIHKYLNSSNLPTLLISALNLIATIQNARSN